AAVAMVLPVREQPVRRFPIIGIIEGPADPDVGEQGAAEIERKTLHPPRTRIRESFLDDALLGDRGEIVGRRPLLAAALDKPVKLIRLQGLPPNRVIAEK